MVSVVPDSNAIGVCDAFAAPGVESTSRTRIFDRIRPKPSPIPAPLEVATLIVLGVPTGLEWEPATGTQCSVPPVNVQLSIRSAGTTTPPRKPLSVLRSRPTATVPASASR